MSTALGLLRRMRLAFPEFVDVRLVREGPYRLRFLCVSLEEQDFPTDRLREWAENNKVAHAQVAFEHVTTLPPQLDDEEALLRRTDVRRALVEGARTTLAALRQNVHRHFPNEVTGVSDAPGRVTIHVKPGLTDKRQRTVLDVARLFLSCDPDSLTVSTDAASPTARVAPRRAETTATDRLVEQDAELLLDYLPDVLDGVEVVLPELPVGASTYASPHDGVTSLLYRLALFERIYVHMPFEVDDFTAWAGASFEEFLDLLPTGRVIPVFAHRSERYAPGLMTKTLESGVPRVMLQGEYTLRALESLGVEHPLLRVIESETGAQLRSVLAESTEDAVRGFRAYSQAIAETRGRAVAAAMTEPALAGAWWPLAAWLDQLGHRFGLPSRDLELCTALEHRSINQGINGTPLSLSGHYLDGYLRFLYGALPGESDMISIPDPTVIGRICFPDTTGLTVRRFADSFNTSAVTAMRELMSSARVQSTNDCEDVVRAFNDELRQFARRSGEGIRATGILLTVAGLIGGLGFPSALGVLSFELARSVLSRKTPAAFATISSKLTGTTREAALLATIKNNS